MNKVDVVIPVYDGFEETVSCIQSALSTLPGDARLVLVNDCSPSAELAAYMRELADSDDRVDLLENAVNLGFVGAVNRGLQHSDSNDVLLLNADVIVANDWLDRMRRRAFEHSSHGTVTAFSNNATICSFPNTCMPNPVPSRITVQELDDCFSVLEDEPCIEIPTGVGSCMYIRRDCLKQVGLLDEDTFGRGYGEENDFCMRAIAKGWINVICPDVYVHHFGGVSFGDEKAALEQRAVQTLNRLYPDYDLKVHQYIQEDPTRGMRLKVLTEVYARSGRPTTLFIGHGLSGGVTRHLRELGEYLEGLVDVLVLNPIGDMRVEVGFIVDGTELNDTMVYDVSAGLGDLVPFLKACGVSHLHFHHIMGLPEQIWGLMDALQCGYDVTLHDYYFINASPTQTSTDGVYQEDESLVEMRLPSGVTPEAWRSSQRAFLEKARYVISPSAATKQIYERYFESVTIEAHPHPDRFMGEPYPHPVLRAPATPLRVGVIGAISIEKGADVLEKTAAHAERVGSPVSFYLVGYAYRPLFHLAGETGPYQEKELAVLVRNLELDVVWFPATWPETYCYTLSAALDLGLPIVAPALGAFSERLTGRPLTRLINTSQPDDVIGVLQSLADEIRQAAADEATIAWQHEQPVDFYREQYVKALPTVRPETGIALDALALNAGLVIASRWESLGERVLYLLFRIRALPVLSRMARLVPVRVQRKVKRLLSRKPIHDL